MTYLYYSHSRQKYNTPAEALELAAIARLFPGVRILNPNGDMRWEGDMAPYLAAARDAYLVVCSEYRECIGRGVYEEILATYGLGHPIYLLRVDPTGANLYAVTQVALHNAADWTETYAKITGYTLLTRVSMEMMH